MVLNKWKWLGHKQHLCVARKCEFSLATLLPNRYLISTIGEWMDEKEMQEIGSGRFIETFVFKTKEKLLDCGCPDILNFQEIDSQGYNTVNEAQSGHIEMCLKWEKKE